MIKVEKNVQQQGRGIFSTIYFDGRSVAEKHNGAVNVFALQADMIESMHSKNVPVTSYGIDWEYAASLLS